MENSLEIQKWEFTFWQRSKTLRMQGYRSWPQRLQILDVVCIGPDVTNPKQVGGPVTIGNWK